MAARIVHDEQPLAVLIVGSVAREISVGDSDVDLAVFLSSYEGPQWQRIQHGGVDVDIERYSGPHFLQNSAGLLLGPKELREAGRFSHAKLVHLQWSSFPLLQRRWANSVAHPDYAAELFANAAHAVVYCNSPDLDSHDRYWSIQGSVAALVTIALDLTSVRFQKPKWVVTDAEKHLQLRFPLLLETFQSIFHLKRADRANVHALIVICEDAMNRGAGMSAIAREEDPLNDIRCRILWKTIKEAKVLADAGNYGAAMYTAFTAGRLMYTILRPDIRPADCAGPTWRELQTWRKDYLKELPSNFIETVNLDARVRELATHVSYLDRQYSAALQIARQLSAA